MGGGAEPVRNISSAAAGSSGPRSRRCTSVSPASRCRLVTMIVHAASPGNSARICARSAASSRTSSARLSARQPRSNVPVGGQPGQSVPGHAAGVEQADRRRVQPAYGGCLRWPRGISGRRRSTQVDEEVGTVPGRAQQVGEVDREGGLTDPSRPDDGRDPTPAGGDRPVVQGVQRAAYRRLPTEQHGQVGRQLPERPGRPGDRRSFTRRRGLGLPDRPRLDRRGHSRLAA